MLFKVKPVPSVCVNVVSESAPNFKTEESDPKIRSLPTVTSLLASSNTNLVAGIVQKTSFVPAAKLTALSLLEEDITVVRVRSELSPSSVPRPTSNSAAV